ncbi:MAG: SHOCT-like domain-containing protein [Anaerolineae bacterium]
MSVNDLEGRIKEKFERKIEKISERLDELREDEELKQTLQEVADQIDQIDAELDALMAAESPPGPGVEERLRAKRERFMAKRERLELKLELRQEMRHRLEESLSEMQHQLQESLDRIHREVKERTEREFDWRQRYTQPQPTASAARRMQEERKKILEMVQQGTIGADDAAQLLDALRDQEESARQHRRRPRWVRIRVTDMNEDRVRVNLTLPVGLVRAGLRAGGSIAGVEGLDTAGLEEMLDRGEVGHLLDVRDEADGERVEIFVE